MTERQRIFAREYVACGCGSEALRKAYPRAKQWTVLSCEKRASRLLALVLPLVEELRAKADLRVEITRADLVAILARALRCRIGDFLTECGRIDVEKVRAAGPELDEYTVEESHLGDVKRKIKKATMVSVADRLSKVMGWDKAIQVELSDGTEAAALREMFAAMSPEERDEWLQRQLSAE
jgi:hypothetical protein